MQPEAHILFLKKVVRMRKHLIRSGTCKKNFLRCCELVKRAENFLMLRPNDRQASVWMRRNEWLVRELMPGEGSSAHGSLNKQLLNLLNDEYSSVPRPCAE